jgi:predicted small secreted protein
MKIPYLPTIVVASALSLASANAMPGLGRETGKFSRSDEPTPKNVRTFEPTKTGKPQASLNFLAPWKQTNLSFLAPWKSQTNLSFLAPWKSQTSLSFLVPWKSQTNLSFLAPTKPQTSLSFLLPWHHPSDSIV